MKITDAKLRIDTFKKQMKIEQKSKSTIIAYLRAVTLFFNFADEFQIKILNENCLLKFKEKLIYSYASASSNLYITGFNAFLSFIKFNAMRIKCIKRQSKDYVSFPLLESDYKKLIKIAEKIGGDTCAVFKTLAGTGTRVSELKFITVKVIKDGQVEIYNKGKVRVLYLNDKLCEYLLEYCAENIITEGIIFTGKDGVSPLSVSAIWKKINSLSAKTGIEKNKLHPHNLRHYYASQFVKKVSNISVLKSLLGHSDIRTTSIYLHPDGELIRKCVNSVVI